MNLIEDLYSGKKRDAIISLLDDSSIRKQILAQVGMELNKRGVVISPSNEQLMVLLSQASFANNGTECVYVAKIVRRFLMVDEPLPRVAEHQGYDLASRCLVSLGFFPKAIEKRWERYGAPKPEFYREVGKTTFHEIGRADVSENFEKWERFMQEMFV